MGLVRLFAHLPAARDDVVVGVATYVAQPELLELPFTETIEAVEGLGRVDVAIAGGAYSWAIRTRLAVFRPHCEQDFAGMRAFGASFHDRAAARQAVEQRALDLAFIRHNPGHTGAREDVFPFVGHRAPTLLFNFKSTAAYVDPEPHRTSALARTYWIPSRADHYRCALSRPQLDGFSSPNQVDALASATEKGGLDPPEEDHLIAPAAKR